MCLLLRAESLWSVIHPSVRTWDGSVLYMCARADTYVRMYMGSLNYLHVFCGERKRNLLLLPTQSMIVYERIRLRLHNICYYFSLSFFLSFFFHNMHAIAVTSSRPCSTVVRTYSRRQQFISKLLLHAIYGNDEKWRKKRIKEIEW